jgi:hypothetical protein
MKRSQQRSEADRNSAGHSLFEKMSWFSSNNKSITKNAQNIITNLHHQLTQQQNHIHELENLVILLQNNSYEHIDREILRLEDVRKDYEKKILDIDEEVSRLRQLSSEMKEKIQNMTLQSLKRNERFNGAGNEKNIEGRSHEGKNIHINDGIGRYQTNHDLGPGHVSMGSTIFSTLEHHDREEENELFDAIKSIESDLIFLLHRNNIDDIIVYLPPSSTTSTSEILSLYRLRDPSDPQTIEDLTSFEKMMAYGPKLIPNSNRSEPDVIEIPCPGIGRSDGAEVGELVGCLQLPIASAVLIEIWKYSPSSQSSGLASSAKYWATVTANQIPYAVLECLYIKSEVRWGFTTVTSIEITARHPVDGHLLVEEISVGG